MHDHNYLNLNSPQEMHNEELSNDLYYDEEDHIDIDPIREKIEDAEEDEFYRNLVEDFPDGGLDYIGTELALKIEEDETSRQYKDERYAKMLKRLGYTDQAMIGGADFPGASTVTHPLISEGCIDYASRAIKEILPPNGPVKTRIIGKETVEKLERAERKRQFVNWVLTAPKLEYRATQEKILTQSCLAGSAFKKLYWDKYRSRLCIDFIPLDQIYIPYHCEKFYEAERLTHLIKLDKDQFKRKCHEGVYITKNAEGLFETVTEESQSMPEYVSDAIQGKDSVTSTEQDEVIILYETQVNLELPWDEKSKGRLAPYIITIAKANNEVLSLYRNWDEKDETLEKLEWIVQYNYITWRGAIGIGFCEILDGVAAAVTGSLRALLDSAHTANFPTLLGTKGAKIVGQNTNVAPGQITQVEGANGMTSKLSDQIMPLQLGQPQPILLQLLEYLDAKVKEFYNTTSSALDNVGDETPVGTTLALIEEGSKRYAAINARVLEAETRTLQIACRIFKHNLEEECIVEELGEIIISRYDFEYDDIALVADPNIYSEGQRYAKNQALLQLADKYPQLYNALEVNRRILVSMDIQDIDRVLSVPQQAGKLNAVAENKSVLDGTPLQVFSDQDHLSHLQTHLGFALSPIFGSNQFNMAKMPLLLSHMQSHVSMLYGQVFNQALVEGGVSNFNILEDESTPDIDKELNKLQDIVLKKVTEMLQPYMQQYAQWMQQVQQANQPPQDPNMMKVQVEQQKLQLEAQEMQQKAQQAQMENQTAQQKLKSEQEYDQTMLNMEHMKTNTQQAQELMSAQIEIEKMKQAQGQHIDEKLLDKYVHDTELQFDHDNQHADRVLKLMELEQAKDLQQQEMAMQAQQAAQQQQAQAQSQQQSAPQQ